MKRIWSIVMICFLASLCALGLAACNSNDDETPPTEYTVTFVADGVTVSTETYTENDKNITVPDVPFKEGYIGVWENYTLTTGNITVNAVYELQYIVTFVADGVTVGTAKYTAGNTNIIEPAIPSKTDYTGAWETYTLTTGDIIVNAVYTPIEYTVTFVADGLTVGTEKYTVENRDITEPAFPLKSEYTGAWESYALTAGNVTVNAVYTPASEGLKYLLSSNDGYAPIGTYAVIGYEGSDSNVVIPDLHDDKPVTYIPYLATTPSQISSITSIVIGNSVTSIGQYAFSDCSSLTSIIIPNSVTSIGQYAFSGCSSLTSIIIPNSVTSIGQYTFSGCSSLTSIIIPNSVTSIGQYAFRNCGGLTSITIPDSVISIGSSAFTGCSNIIQIENEVHYVDKWAIGCDASVTSAILRQDTIGIASYAFSSCNSLTSITIPDSVIYIGDSAFSSCNSLTSITIPDSVIYIGDSAFYRCRGLTSITIPDSVTSIGELAFIDCSGLTSITIPDSVTSIGELAFINCSALRNINFSGTRAQWNAITKENGWNNNTGNYTITCVDGTISK